jgi:catechol 2,3-dioxygenase-like lactoylglutathione lyase family enzyme
MGKGEQRNLEIEEQITFLYVRIYRTGKTAYLGICENRDRVNQGEQEGVIFTLVVDDVRGWYDYLGDQGWEMLEEPKYNEEYLITHFFLRDPDGYQIEIQRFEDPRWQGPAPDYKRGI